MSQQSDLKASFENAQYNLTRNLSLLSTVILLTIGTVFYFENDISAYFIFSGGVISLGSFILTIKTNRYRLSAILCLSLLSMLTVLNLTVSSNFHHVGDYFWIICIVTAGFFILGKKWGIGLIIFNMLSLFIVFYLVREGFFKQIPKAYTSFSQINFLINICIGSVLLSYVIIEFLKQNKQIAKGYLQANSELEALNEEKTVMLREIHHRVKNNLQIVTSLLRLQSKEQSNNNTINEFSEAINRISAIAKIHDKMYNSKALNRIDLSEYLKELVKDLIDSYTIDLVISSNISSNIKAIPPKDLVPIALIFNELVTNSVKHAFKGKTEGNISIYAFISETNQVELIYQDNGSWIAPSTENKSIGLELIDSFVDQLDGTCSVDKENGTTYRILFLLE